MPITTARILQSFGLNSGRSAIASRELGVTADTEQPVIGTTVGGAKYLGTEDYVTIATASPAAITLIRRSFVEYLCDTVGAGADIALDIRAGAQTLGARLKVYALGATAYKVRVQYATGVYSDVPAGAATEFVWSGTAWNDARPSNAVLLAGIDPVNGNAGTYGTVAGDPLTPWIIPKGTYMMSVSPSARLEIYTGTTWKGSGRIGGIVISDGVNYRIYFEFDLESVYYRKLA